MPSHAHLQTLVPMVSVATNSIATIPDIGNIALLSSAQIDARFQTPPPNGSMATGTNIVLPVLLIKRAGAWHTVSLTLL